MTTKIDGVEYEIAEGVVAPYTRAVTSFTSPITSGVGAQVFGQRGEPFTLRLIQYRNANAIELMKSTARYYQGRIVRLEVDGVVYSLPQWGGYRFLVEEVTIESARVIPRAVGVRSTGSYDHSPAARVVSRWLMRAIR